jgi:hypothetical protein
MNSVLYWFGVFHAVIYAIGGATWLSWAFVEWLIGRLKIKRDLIRALAEYYKKRNAERFDGA